jgi:hypothetical protein
MTWRTDPLKLNPPNEAELALLIRGSEQGRQRVAETIESGVPVTMTDGSTWYDVRHLLDPRENAPAVVDMVAETLAYAQASAVAFSHPDVPYLFRMLWPNRLRSAT